VDRRRTAPHVGLSSSLPLHLQQPRPFNLTIASAESFRPPAWDDRDPAVHIHRNHDGSIWAYSYARGSEQWMHLPGVASFRFGSHDGEAVVIPDAQTPAVQVSVIEDAYQRAVLPMVLHAHGQEILHASAVIMPRGVVALCGRSQTGKSTTAYGLHRRGHRVWADDALVFDASAESVDAIPYPHRLRIREEAAEYFDLHELRRRDTSSWTALEQAQDDPARLACLFLLERDIESSGPVELVRLSSTQTFANVMTYAYLFRLDDPERKRQMLEKYLALMTRVPVFRMRFRATLDQLPAMLDQIESAVQAMPVEP
jgi:hypothetical protein